ncbi:MAG: beta-lactamase family protein [Bacteroidales bacterium]|nr:beta-lactamase family protein [Bacteroidales bacterium]
MKAKQIIIVSAILLITISVELSFAQLKFSKQSFDSLNLKLEYLVAELVEKDSSVRNCVLFVLKNDSSFFWSGAAGIASQENQLPMTQKTPFYIASITKLYTATIIMRLYENGIISLEDPISKYLPEELYQGIHIYQGKDYSGKITIKQLLSHTSGIADYYSEKSKAGKSLFELFLEDPERTWTVDETIERARKDMEPNFPPGTDASYSDTNFQLLGKLIEMVTGKSLDKVYDEFIFSPLALKHTWLTGYSKSKLNISAAPADVFYNNRIINTVRSNGSYWADGGIISTAEECIIFLKALNEGHIVSKSTLKLMHNWHNLEFPIKYGYGTMCFELPPSQNIPPLWGHSGSTGSFLYYSEEWNMYIAGTINQVEAKSAPFKLMISVMQVIQSEMEKQQTKNSI